MLTCRFCDKEIVLTRILTGWPWKNGNVKVYSHVDSGYSPCYVINGIETIEHAPCARPYAEGERVTDYES